MPTVLEALRSFIDDRKPEHNNPSLLDRVLQHVESLEFQINVDPSKGERVKEDKRTWFVDPANGRKFWPIRIPKHADSTPEWNDYPLRWSLGSYVEAIGSTGWDWRNRRSLSVGFDVDSITGHAAGVGISDAELERVKAAALALPYVDAIKSSGGGGIHLYVQLPNVPTANHTEHAALARTILGMMSTEAGFDFASAIDACGGNMWFISKKATAANGGFALIKPATKVLSADDIPANWRDHVDVVTRKRTKVRVRGVTNEESFSALVSARKAVPLDDKHKAVIAALTDTGFSTLWIPDHHLLQTHTAALKVLMVEHKGELGLAGFFDTNSPGSDPGSPNCFLFPLPNGAWKVVRFAQGHREAETWEQDEVGWTWCYFNRPPTMVSACRAAGGTEVKDGSWQFETFDIAREAIRSMGAELELSNPLTHRQTVLKAKKDGRLIVCVKQIDGNACPGKGWVKSKDGWWERVLDANTQGEKDAEAEFDNTIRIAITPSGQSAGTYICTPGGLWCSQTASNAKMAIQSLVGSKKEAEEIIGESVLNPWQLVSAPFQPEWLGGRKWNMDAPQLSVTPLPVAERDMAVHPHWDMILTHIGQTLTEPLQGAPWAVAANIRTGADYLRAWYASIIREPFEPLPYLFLHGPENSGKSIFHEAFKLLVTCGVVLADRILSGKDQFNGQLQNAVLCVVEETNLSQSGSKATNAIREYVTAKTISIRRMHTNAFLVPNTTHWCQMSNDCYAVPILPGDTRIVVVYVAELPPSVEIPKRDLLDKLSQEAPAFLRTLLDLQLPAPIGRLRIPVIETKGKAARARESSPMHTFLSEKCALAPDAEVPKRWVFEAYESWCETNGVKAMERAAFGKALHTATHHTLSDKKVYGDGGERVDGYLGIDLLDRSSRMPRPQHYDGRCPLEAFICEHCFPVPGQLIPLAEFHERFQAWLSPDQRRTWTKPNVTKSLPPQFPIGTRVGNRKFIGNLSWELVAADAWRWIASDGKLIQTDAKVELLRIADVRGVIEGGAFVTAG